MQRLEVSGAVRHIYIYMYIYVIRRLKVKFLVQCEIRCSHAQGDVYYYFQKGKRTKPGNLLKKNPPRGCWGH
jgi:hypothetical protein